MQKNSKSYKEFDISNKKVPLYELGICSILVGVVGASMFSMPLAGLLFEIIGTGCVIGGVLETRDRTHDKLWENTGLHVGDKDKREYPIIREIKETAYGESIRISSPVGLSSEDFRKKSDAIKEHFRAESIEVTFNNGFIFLQLHRGKLPKECEYEPIETRGKIEVPIGRSVNGIVTIDLSKGPHTLIAGESGSGKSTTTRVITTYLIDKKPQVKIHLIDMKIVEFAIFRKSKRVDTYAKNIQEATKIIRKLLNETNRRYELFFQNECVDIEEYNKKNKSKKLSYEVLEIDEYADLADTEVVDDLIELLRKSRAAGIHCIIATQRPCAKTLDTRIKANIPYIIGLKTINGTNSSIVLDQTGLENLRGQGHSLVKTEGITEVQCFNLSADKARNIIRYTYKEELAAFEVREKEDILNVLEVLEGGKKSNSTKRTG